MPDMAIKKEKDGRLEVDPEAAKVVKMIFQMAAEQNELSDKIKLKDFLGIQKFDTEKLREIIKVIRVHSQDEIEIEWNFDDIFSEQR